MGQQCDGPGCQIFGQQPNAGWLVLGVQHPDTGFLAAITGQQHTPVLGTFCSMRCVSGFAYAHAAIDGPATGTEPEPTGTGWPDQLT